MSQQDVIRAWKDPEYRNSLSAAELEGLPVHPAGVIEAGLVPLDAADARLTSTVDRTCTDMCCGTPSCNH